jgi:hypothetical protein
MVQQHSPQILLKLSESRFLGTKPASNIWIAGTVNREHYAGKYGNSFIIRKSGIYGN